MEKVKDKRRRVFLSTKEVSILKDLFVRLIVPFVGVIVVSSVLLFLGLRFLLQKASFQNYGIAPSSVLYSVSQEPAGSIGKAGMPSGKAVPIAAKEYPSQRTSALKAVAPEPTSQKPVSLGQIEVERGETVSYLLRNIYGNYNRSQMNAFLRANPHLLKNVNYLQVGEIISVPAVGQALSPLPGERCWVQVGSGKDLGTAYKLIKDRARYLPPVRLFPYWNMQEGLVFAICLKEGFGDEAAASQIVKQLPPDLAGQAKVIRHWSEGTEFYVSK